MTSAGGWRRRSKQRQYRAVWVEGRDLVGQGILLSGRMMAGAQGHAGCIAAGAGGLWALAGVGGGWPGQSHVVIEGPG